MSFEDRRELSAIISYLYSRHGSGALATAFGVPRDTVLAFGAKTSSGEATDVPAGAMSRLGVRYAQRWERSSGDMFWFAVQTPLVVEVSGYDRLKQISLSAGSPTRTGLDSLTLEIDSTLASITATRGKDTLMTLPIRDPLLRLVTDKADGDDPHKIDAPVVVDGAADGVVLRLLFENITGRRVDGRIALNSASGYILVGHR